MPFSLALFKAVSSASIVSVSTARSFSGGLRSASLSPSEARYPVREAVALVRTPFREVPIARSWEDLRDLL